MSKQRQAQPIPPDEAETLPAVVQQRPPTLALRQDAPVSEWHHNFDLTTRAGRDALVNASNVPDWIPSDGKPLRIEATHYLVFPDQYLDRNSGEIVPCTSLVFVDRQGLLCKFRNDWSLRRLHACMSLYSVQEWADGIPIECYRGNSREQGKMYGSFRIITKPQPESAPKDDDDQSDA